MALAAKGFTITYVNTQSIHHHTTKPQPGVGDDIFVSARQAGFDIHYEVISDGLPNQFDRSLSHDQFMAALLHVLSAHVEELVATMIKSVRPSDLLHHRRHLLRVAVSHSEEVWPHLRFILDGACIDGREDAINYIPGVPTIEPSDLPSYLQENYKTTVCHQISFNAFEDAKGADYVLCNSVQELESETILALQIEKPFYAIGPIFSSSGFSKRTVATSLWSESDCTEWLNTKPPASVLYVSFGSYAHINKRDLEEIAMGVLLSGVSFIWVLRPDIVSAKDKEPLPAKFFEECKQKGMVVPWCQQNAVLSHPSVGGFLTHCGWNSIMESAWCGVPLLCFPLLTDQFTNRKLVVDDLKIGLDLMGRHRKLTKQDVSAKIKDLMSGKQSEDLKKGLEKVKQACQNAVVPGGSSRKNLDLFINDLNERVQSRPS